MTEKPSQLCNLCQDINVNSLVTYDTVGLADFDASFYSYPHQPSFNALVRSAKTCPLCYQILFILEYENSFDPIPASVKNSEDSMVYLSGSYSPFPETMRTAPKKLSSIRVLCGKTLWKMGILKLTARPDDPLALSGDVTGRYKEISDRNSTAAFDQLRRWYHDCLAQDARCQIPVDPEWKGSHLPTRVIDVGSSDPFWPLRLIETKGRKGTYAALTYCWGTSQAFTSRRETYQNRLDGFLLEDLPPTIRDALIVTRELGISYLWIDAICIIQGDAADWLTESAKMAQVYGNAAITISATASQDTSIGCFVPKYTAQTPVALKSKCSSSNDEGTMFVSARTTSKNLAVDKSVLNTRAWCLQERVLSRRIIHFAKDQMYWECRSRCVAESDNTHLAQGSNSFDKGHCEWLFFDDPGAAPPEKVFKHWHMLVNDYTARNLSYGSDKLTAVSGLAEIVHRLTGAEYLAGLWKQDLPAALLWNVSVEGTIRRPSKRASEWRAPSWSWASIDGPVESDWLRQIIENPEESLSFEFAEIVSCFVKLASNNLFSAIRSASLRLKTRLMKAKRAQTQKQHDYGGHVGNLDETYGLLDDDDNDIGSVWFDDNTVTPPVEFDCLVICTTERKWPDRSAGYVMVVDSTGKAGHYERVGCGFIKGREHFANKPVEVTLL